MTLVTASLAKFFTFVRLGHKQCKKFSYRRDSARRRSLRRSKSFKVIDVGTDRKPICDFISE